MKRKLYFYLNTYFNPMAASDLRQRVIAYIQGADTRFLRLVEALAETYQENEEIVAFSVEGNPLNLDDYNAALLEAEAEVKRGEIISSEALEKDSETW